jgi:hypothetical protein
MSSSQPFIPSNNNINGPSSFGGMQMPIGGGFNPTNQHMQQQQPGMGMMVHA